LIAYDSREKHIDFNITISSLNNCVPAPTAIGIVQSSRVSPCINLIENVNVFNTLNTLNIRPLDVFNIVPELLKKYTCVDEKDVYFWLVTAGNKYPQYSLEEYIKAYPNMDKALHKKIKDTYKDAKYKGTILGLSGLFLRNNPKKQMDMELKCLQNGEDMSLTQERNSIGYVTEHATVDILELNGGIFFNNHVIDYNKFAHIDRNLLNVIPNDLIFSNICSEMLVLRTQIYCHILNHSVFERLGMIKSIDNETKTKLYINGLNELNNKGVNITLWRDSHNI